MAVRLAGGVPAISYLGLVLLLAAVATTACGSSSADRPRASAGTPVSAPTARPPAGFDILLGVEAPDWLATGFGSLWVKRDDGAVVRVSPTGKIEATIAHGLSQLPVCQGIGVSREAVWVCSNTGTVARIDPKSNHVVATLHVGKINDQGRLTAYAGAVWVLTGDGDRLEAISERDDKVHATIALGTFCTDVADTAPGGVLWVACSYRGVLLRVDLRTGQVTARLRHLRHPAAVSVADDVWVADDSGLERVEPDTLRVVQRVRVQPTAIRAAADGVWVREEGRRFLMRIDPRTGRIVSRTVSNRLPSAGDLIRFGRRWWATASDDNAVVRLR